MYIFHNSYYTVSNHELDGIGTVGVCGEVLTCCPVPGVLGAGAAGWEYIYQAIPPLITITAISMIHVHIMKGFKGL